MADLSLEFATETSIAVAGGKTSQPKKRNRDSRPSGNSSPTGALASPLFGADTTAVDSSADHLRPINSGSFFQTGAPRLRGGPESRPLSADNQTNGLVPSVRHQQQQLPQQQQAGIILTVKQLRARADQIEQILRLARPNELQPPLIEARSQVLDYADLEPDQACDEKPTSGADGEETSACAGAAEDQPRSVQPDNDSGAVSSSGGASIEEADKDYQLNELVLFTCSLQPPAQPYLSQLNASFRWLINGKEVSFS